MKKTSKQVSSEIAYDFIRTRILTGDYPPGFPIATSLVAGELKISRTPVRDALKTLESDGLVTITTHLGASVRQMTVNEYHDICDLRCALETHAAGLAAERCQKKDLDLLVQAAENMRKITNKFIHHAGSSQEQMELWEELVKCDVRFHLSVVFIARNQLIRKQIISCRLLDRIVAAENPNSPEKRDMPIEINAEHREAVLQEHQAILDAIKLGDVPRARLAMERHLVPTFTESLHRLSVSRGQGADLQLDEKELTFLV